MQNFVTFMLIRNAMDCVNDQLKVIANWPERASQKEDTLQREVIMQLQSNPQFCVEGSVKCMMVVTQKLLLMKTFLDLPDEMKSPTASVEVGVLSSESRCSKVTRGGEVAIKIK
ncbi:retrotransposon protein [Cucumis melo var. makuwa]|uniref:Retrotransposon protein n=1 Tax=Cucumis melo var. makuwa TaxID=1194695 RepID=A0A5A7T4S2_CUCMM|nr:retrotransposon protein [Cucumis melo var. makuwa]